MGYGIIRSLILGVIGGLAYVSIELVWRGYSHPSMFILGAIMFLLIGSINEYFTWNMLLWKQCGICAVIITASELMSGLLINKVLGWHVWDYSQYPFSFMGQINLFYSIGWFFLSFIGIVLDDALRWKLFGEEKPRYKIF